VTVVRSAERLGHEPDQRRPVAVLQGAVEQYRLYGVGSRRDAPPRITLEGGRLRASARLPSSGRADTFASA
jgi:hypothetical protein